MATKRQVLGQLKRDELIAAVDLFQVPVADRRVRDLLIDALASSRKARLTEILDDLKRDRLKELCRDLGLDDGGKRKAVLVDRLTGNRTDGAASGRGTAAGRPTAAGDGNRRSPSRKKVEPHPPLAPTATVSQEVPKVDTTRRNPRGGKTKSMATTDVNWIVNFIWGIADDVLRDVYVRGKYRDVILPMVVIRRLDTVLEPTKKEVLEMKARLDKAGITNQDAALRQASRQAFYNASPFKLRDLRSRARAQQLKADFEAYLDGFSANVREILEKFKFLSRRLSREELATTV